MQRGGILIRRLCTIEIGITKLRDAHRLFKRIWYVIFIHSNKIIRSDNSKELIIIIYVQYLILHTQVQREYYRILESVNYYYPRLKVQI